jgi:predicted site-specific integrase-resolvase
MPEPRRLLNLAQVARVLDVPYTRLYELVHTGRIEPDATDGRALLFSEERLVRLLPALHKFSISARTVGSSLSVLSASKRAGFSRARVT